jgi:hypothetical protein
MESMICFWFFWIDNVTVLCYDLKNLKIKADIQK